MGHWASQHLSSGQVCHGIQQRPLACHPVPAPTHQRLGQPAQQLGLVYRGNGHLIKGGRCHNEGAVPHALALQLALGLEHQCLQRRGISSSQQRQP